MNSDILVVVARHRRPGRGPRNSTDLPQLAASCVTPRISRHVTTDARRMKEGH